MDMAGMSSLLRSHFGFDKLRPHQQEVLTELADGHDCIAVLPTGGGKSLLYALPALLRPGLVLVISPLVALIRDQANRFAANNIRALAFEGSLSSEEKQAVWDEIDSGEVKLLLVSPERLARPDFRRRLQNTAIQLVAVDEAHCISHWGSHFRPEYRMLGEFLQDFGKIQKLAVTATATGKVRKDIIDSLHLTKPKTISAQVTRDNLSLKVMKAPSVAKHFESVLHTVLSSEGSGIVYAPTRKMVREVHRMLVQAKIPAIAYHAGLTYDERHRAQLHFMSGKARVVVATNAFGMGIDKPDIRFVHHAGLPGSIEGYVQEIGRAGRDGMPAKCHLIYGAKDYHIHKFMIQKTFPDMKKAQEALTLVRRYVQDSFGEPEGAVRDYLQHHLPTEKNFDDILELLCREGLLSRLTASTSAPWDEPEVLIADGKAARDSSLWQQYPDRLDDQLNKLRAVREYVELAGGEVAREAYLQHYFREL